MYILIAEDEAVIALNLAWHLEELGHQIVGPVSRIEDAEKLVFEHHVDMALVDIDLHGKEDGIALARMLSQQKIPSLFLTARPALARANADAAWGVLAKPFQLTDVDRSVEVVESIMQGGSPPPPDVPRALELFVGGH